MRIRPTMNRRDLLRRGGAGLFLPMMTPLLPGLARAADGFPQRFLVFTHGQGTLQSSMVQSGATETAWELGSILAPLQRHKERLVVLDGVHDSTNLLDTPYNGHTRCRLHTLTAQGMTWTAGDSGVFPSSAGGPSDTCFEGSRWRGTRRRSPRGRSRGTRLRPRRGAWAWAWRCPPRQEG